MRSETERKTGTRRGWGGTALRRWWRGMVTAVAVLLAAGAAGCVSSGGGVMADTDLTTQDLTSVRGQFNTVYDFLKAHGRADFTDLGGRSHEILTVWGRGRRSLSSDNALGALLYVDEEEVPNPVPFLRQMPMERVERLRILRPSETSSRFGGDGRRGSVAIWTTGD